MPVLQASNLGDLITLTLRDLGENKITDLTSDLQDHVAMNSLLRQNNIKLESGTGIQWNVALRTAGSFSFVGLYAQDNVNPSDSTVTANLPWRHCTVNYAIDERELAMNRSPRRIVDILKERRHLAMVDQAEGMEAAFWGYPLSTDDVTPHGVAYHVVKSATAATKTNNDGFNGLAQSGYTEVSGINPTNQRRWRNYSDAYTAITKDDLIRKLRRAMRRCNFKPPAQGGVASYNTGNKWGIYVNQDTVAKMEELLEQQNENLGNDLASKDGEVVFRRTMVTPVPKLDADTTDPIYGLNWGVFKTYILRGYWMKEVKVEVTPGQHTVCSVHQDSSLNWVCKDRRLNFVISNGTTTPNN